MKKLILLLLMATAFGCKKDEPLEPKNVIGGKDFVAKWKISNNLQQYIHLGFGSSSTAKIHYSSQKTVNYGNEDFTYTKSGDSYIIKGKFYDSHYLPSGTVKTWTVTPKIDNATIGSSKYYFEIDGLTFVEE